jgi:hypothetical protein
MKTFSNTQGLKCFLSLGHDSNGTELLLYKHEALNSNCSPSPLTKKKKESWNLNNPPDNPPENILNGFKL